ncbi:MULTISPECIES: MotA/TolQ/ExbB proton channel family protein [unclassified Methylophilus]|uniref:MotA/TolQ/ExbB proton channel family protein n=1 Tax=unclassified Methylophilus TaxID=2630143 RepID=UPI0006FC6ABE|nr:MULTISPECIES: MotA/TolQ/ExbB proton channel family protein [unclassified Methylophilus]KQT41875.1 flagellar motor protein MotA [Methylophilus sp. Leaf416]KQT56076.1 flagellar motor protein MotA [Methylophilus sp. Leaf459]
MKKSTLGLLTSLCLLTLALPVKAAWNADWATQQKITIDTANIKEAVNQAPVLVRLHSGNFDFTGANVDGSDIRFIAADDKTELMFSLEKYDAVNELAVAWVVLPQLSSANKDLAIGLYTGNESAKATSDVQALNDPALLARFAFSDKALLKDSGPSQLTASGNATQQKAGLIAESATLNNSPLTITLPAAPQLANGATWSVWLKPANLPQTAEVFKSGNVSLKLNGNALVLQAGAATVNGGELKPGQWQHIALVFQGGQAVLYINGQSVGQAPANDAQAAATLTVGDALNAEIDELQLASTARSAAWLSLVAQSQGADAKLVKVTPAGESEGEEEGEANYMGILIDSLTVDAKVVIAILAVMFAISVWVMFSKARLVTITDKDNALFLKRFQQASTQDLLNLDKTGTYKNSNLFGLYKAGLREIKKREHDGKVSLGGASIDAIKAAVDADLVRETQRMNSMMVLLTIAISGGPFLGLLGTVVGVMITFAAIAAAGDVNVNAIAPGIAAALLATVAGLGVAIPALFGYNYLASRVKNITIAMQIFVDEFITRTAELYGKE